MTDFLGRVAARAVGASASAQPRLPGLFETAGAPDGATLEVVEEEVVAPAPQPRSASTPAVSERRGAAAQPAETQPVQPPPRAETPDALAESRPPELIDLVAHSNYVPAPAAPHGRPAEPDPVPAVLLESSVPEPVVAAAPLAQALPAVRLREPAPPAPEAAAHVEPPPVRVHIGRLEVRANLQPVAPEPPRRERARNDGLTLTDYLRGKREVGA